MEAVIVEHMGPSPALARRVRLAAIAVPTVVGLAGAAAVRDSRFILVAAAVIFGWSQLAGA